eukprot:1077535-Amphidinium_carterae.1
MPTKLGIWGVLGGRGFATLRNVWSHTPVHLPPQAAEIIVTCQFDEKSARFNTVKLPLQRPEHATKKRRIPAWG